MRIPNVALAEEARGRIVEPETFVGVDWASSEDRTAIVRLTNASGRWVPVYGIDRRKPAERCAVMGDGIEVVRGVVVE